MAIDDGYTWATVYDTTTNLNVPSLYPVIATMTWTGPQYATYPTTIAFASIDIANAFQSRYAAILNTFSIVQGGDSTSA